MWSLSESKIVASVHIMVHSRNLVSVSREIKQRFHRFGIHSSTIQPEIVASTSAGAGPGGGAGGDGDGGVGGGGAADGLGPLSHISEAAAAERGLETEGCPVLCAEGAACADNQCCPPTTGSRAGSVGGGGGVGTSRAGSPH